MQAMTDTTTAIRSTDWHVVTPKIVQEFSSRGSQFSVECEFNLFRSAEAFKINAAIARITYSTQDGATVLCVEFKEAQVVNKNTIAGYYIRSDIFPFVSREANGDLVFGERSNCEKIRISQPAT